MHTPTFIETLTAAANPALQHFLQQQGYTGPLRQMLNAYLVNHREAGVDRVAIYHPHWPLLNGRQGTMATADDSVPGGASDGNYADRQAVQPAQNSNHNNNLNHPWAMAVMGLLAVYLTLAIIIHLKKLISP